MLIDEITHPSHPQHWLKLERPRIPFICDECHELGFGTCYECKDCNFHMHKECALPSTPAHHPFFKRCEFEFGNPLSNTRVCDACWKDIKAAAYQCHEDSFDLHPCCLTLPKVLAGDNVKLHLKKKVSARCMKCHSRSNSRSGAKGWAYESTCGKYCFHVACVKEMIYEAWENGYFNKGREEEEEEETDASRMQVAIPESSNGVEIYSSRRKIATTFKTVVSVLTLIVSAIFGDPITAFTALIIALAKSLSVAN